MKASFSEGVIEVLMVVISWRSDGASAPEEVEFGSVAKTVA